MHIDAKSIFLKCIEDYPADEWSGFLQEACAGNQQLRMEVEKLLEGHQRLGEYREPSMVATRKTASFPQFRFDENCSGSGGNQGLIDVSNHPMIGPFKLLEELGHGGMGTVYMAQQTSPVKRKVALKVIKPGMDTKEVVARFEAERQALAMMDHANIAKVLDGGTTDEGRPYFVMELVRGVPITKFCEHKKLPLSERLELFIDTCRAVQHAHQKGIIHRDLKPSNLLVTMHDHRPVVKVIDFGVAKALNQELTDRTLFTRFSEMIGTPIYMAPEQAQLSGLDVDTRSDIYSLGVILYELLTGSTPFDRDTMSRLGIDDIRKLIQEKEPERPSARISTLKAGHLPTVGRPRSLDNKDTVSQLRRELDWIVMKALEKDRERRYETANAFAIDIQRYLNDEPVAACPPSILYLTRKFLRRNQAAMATIGVVVVTLLIAVALSASWAIKANQALDELREQEQVAVQAAVRAEVNEEKAMQLVYASDIKLASQSLQDGDIRRVSDLLDGHLPLESKDRRGLEWWYLKQFTKSRNTDIATGTGGTSVIRIGPNGCLLAAGQHDGSLIFWDIEQDRFLERVHAHFGLVRGLDFSPDGRQLASIGDDGMIRIWDIAQRLVTLSFRAHEAHGFRVFYIRDGQQLVSCGEEEEARIWNSQTGESIAILKNHGFGVEMAAMDVSNDRKWIASQNEHGSVNVWNAETYQHRCQLDIGQNEGPGSYALCASFSPDDRYIAVGTDLDVIHLCDSKTGRSLRSFVGHKDRIQDVAFHSEGRVLASSDKVGTVRTWSLTDLASRPEKSRDIVEDWPRFFQGHTSRVWSVVFSADGERLISASKDGNIRSWTKQDRIQYEIDGGEDAYGVAFVPTSDELLITGNNSLHCWNEDDGKLSPFQPPFEEKAHSLVVEPTSKRCFTGHQRGIVRAWDLESKKMLWSKRVHADTVKALAISENGHLLATGGYDGTAKLFDLDSWTNIASFDLKRPHCYDVAFSANGQQLACATESEIMLFDIETHQQVDVLRQHHDSVSCLAYAPKGDFLVSGSSDRTIRTWNTVDGQMQHVMPAHQDGIDSITISPDGQTIVSGDESGFLSFSHVKTGRFLFSQQVANDRIISLRFSDDGRRLAIGVKRNPVVILRTGFHPLGTRLEPRGKVAVNQ